MRVRATACEKTSDCGDPLNLKKVTDYFRRLAPIKATPTFDTANACCGNHHDCSLWRTAFDWICCENNLSISWLECMRAYGNCLRPK
jgi:hypothetical protein